MPVLHLADLANLRLPASDSYVTYWDQLLPAFGIRIGKGSLTFVIMKGTERKCVSATATDPATPRSTPIRALLPTRTALA